MSASAPQPSGSVPHTICPSLLYRTWFPRVRSSQSSIFIRPLAPLVVPQSVGCSKGVPLQDQRITGTEAHTSLRSVSSATSDLAPSPHAVIQSTYPPAALINICPSCHLVILPWSYSCRRSYRGCCLLTILSSVFNHSCL